MHIAAYVWIFQIFRRVCETCILFADDSSGERSCWDPTVRVPDC